MVPWYPAHDPPSAGGVIVELRDTHSSLALLWVSRNSTPSDFG